MDEPMSSMQVSFIILLIDIQDYIIRGKNDDALRVISRYINISYENI